jgi:hypothetical protein
MRAHLSGLVLFLIPFSASAAFHLWDITEVYSNASGSVQFIELTNCPTVPTCNNEHFVATHSLTSNSTVYVVPTDLPSSATAGKHILFATPAFASQPGAVPPDYTFPAANFMSNVADTINWASSTDVFTFNVGALPTDGIKSLNEPFGSNTRTIANNTPTNFAGQTGPEPNGSLMMLAGAAAVFGLAHRRNRLQLR